MTLTGTGFNATQTYTTVEKILSVSHYSVIANIIQKSTHFNAPTAGYFSPGEVSLGGESMVWSTRGRIALTCLNMMSSSVAGRLYVAVPACPKTCAED